jgi:hypothetical protein
LWICHQVDLSPSAVRRAALTRFPITATPAAAAARCRSWVAPSLAVMHPLTARTHRRSRRRQRKISPPSHVTVGNFSKAGSRSRRSASETTGKDYEAIPRHVLKARIGQQAFGKIALGFSSHTCRVFRISSRPKGSRRARQRYRSQLLKSDASGRPGRWFDAAIRTSQSSTRSGRARGLSQSRLPTA